MAYAPYDGISGDGLLDESSIPFAWRELFRLYPLVDSPSVAPCQHNGGILADTGYLQAGMRGSYLPQDQFSLELGVDTPSSSREWAPSHSELHAKPYESHEALIIRQCTPTAEYTLENYVASSPSSRQSPQSTCVVDLSIQEEHYEKGYQLYETQSTICAAQSFPLPSQEHGALRRSLAVVLTSPWKLQNIFEPRHSALLDFLRYNVDTRRWCCCFWVDGNPCNCSFTKKDQAKNHIRYHIKHLPFSCKSKGTCPKDGTTCRRRFCSAEALQKHRGPQKQCSDCGKRMLKTNLPRHLATSCPYRRHNS